MHPNVNFGIKIMRNTGKKLAKSFDDATMYANSAHQDVSRSLGNLVSSLNQSIELQLAESFSRDKLFFSGNISSEKNLPTKYWLFDGLCSVSNLENKFPFISMSLTYFENNEAQHAVLYNPLTDEVYSATKGAGAQFNQRRLKYTPQDVIAMYYNESNTHAPDQLQQSQYRRVGSTQLSIVLTASNRGDFCIIPTSQLNSPKMSAAKLIAKESGLNFFKQENQTTWICSSKYLDRNTCQIHANLAS